MTTTRNDKFKEAFSNYVENSSINLDSLDLPPLSWNIDLITKNTKENYHHYTFEIPRKVEQYIVDAHHDPNGGLIEQKIVYRSQHLPNIEKLQKDFYNYFEPFVLKKRNILVSYTDIQNIELTENGLRGEIIVLYYKSHLPYPYQNTSVNINYLTDNINYLTDNITYLKENIERRDKYIQELQGYILNMSNTNIRMEKMLENERLFHDEYRKRTEKKIHSFYLEKKVFDDCPVCFEKILPEMMYISTCFHNICLDCSSKCKNCPLCREPY